MLAKYVSSILLSVVLFGCSHAVYQSETRPEFEDRVEKIVASECHGKCELKYCWLETKEIPFCKLEFSSLKESARSQLVQNIDLAMKKRNLKVGFCGVNGESKNSQSQSASAFLGFLGSGLAAAADHGSPTFVSSGSASDEHITTSTEHAGINEDVLWKACATEPSS